MRLKFQSLSLLDHQNMPKPIPHCSNSIKIVFWAWEGVKVHWIQKFQKQQSSVVHRSPKSRCTHWNSNFHHLSPPPPHYSYKFDWWILIPVFYRCGLVSSVQDSAMDWCLPTAKHLDWLSSTTITSLPL